MKTRKKVRSDKTFWIVRNNDCCTYKETYLFRSKRAAKHYEREFTGDFELYPSKYSLRELRAMSRTSYELASIESDAKHVK